MNGWDFSIFWHVGQAVLHGQDPYSVPNFFYPLPFAYFLAIFGLFPQEIAFWLWIAFNVGILIYFFKRQFWQWIFYLPVLHLLSSGQVDLFLWGLERSISKNWRGAFIAAFITLKPQVALVLLSWHILQWVKYDRKMLLRFTVITAVLWGVPFLWYPGWLSVWTHLTSPLSPSSASNTPSVFSLLKVFPSLWPFIIVPALLIFIITQFQSKEIARAGAMLGSPSGLFYSTMALLGTAPSWLLVPLSLLAAAITIFTNNFIAFAALPVAVIVWRIREERQQETANQHIIETTSSINGDFHV